MADRKAVNKYYPPEWEPKHGSVNKFRGQHPLRDRARKLDQGILIIRFEMPWNIWCTTCKNMVGRGVRYNAEKKKNGAYYSTPIWQFSMKCHLCPGRIVIETDPKNCDYRIVSGAQRKCETWDAASVNLPELPDDREKAAMAQDPMLRLEHSSVDKKKAEKQAPALVRLLALKEETTADDYGANAALRKKMRAARKEHRAGVFSHRKLLKKASLPADMPLVREREEDVKHAKSIRFLRQDANATLRSKMRTLKQQSIFDKPVLEPSAKVATKTGKPAARTSSTLSRLEALSKAQKSKRSTPSGTEGPQAKRRKLDNLVEVTKKEPRPSLVDY